MSSGRNFGWYLESVTVYLSSGGCSFTSTNIGEELILLLVFEEIVRPLLSKGSISINAITPRGMKMHMRRTAQNCELQLVLMVRDGIVRRCRLWPPTPCGYWQRPRSVAELRAIVLGGETGRSNPGLPKAARDERMCWAVMCNKWVTWSHVVTQLVVT